MAGYILREKPKLVVELGTYAGRSFLPILWALKENKSGKAIGIDAYDSKLASAQEYPGSSEWWLNNDLGLIEKKFHAFMKAFDVAQYAEIIKKKTDDVIPPDNIDFLHIDAGHTEVAMRDATRFGAKVRVGGVVICDDVAWVGGSILRAIDELNQMGFEEVFMNKEQNWNCMQRVK